MLLRLLQQRAQQQLGKMGNLWRQLCGPTGAVSALSGTLNGILIVPSTKTSLPHTLKKYIYTFFDLFFGQKDDFGFFLQSSSSLGPFWSLSTYQHSCAFELIHTSAAPLGL